MDANKLMLDYFDEDITHEGEQDLFHSMAYDDGLRAEFKNLMKIKNSIKTGFTGFAPTNNSTNVIFSKLGYSIPPVSAPVPVTGNFLTWMKPIYGYGAASLLTAIITFTIAYFMFNPAVKATNETYNNKQNKIQTETAPENKIAEIKSKQNDNKQIIKYVYIAKESNKIDDNSSNQEPVKNISLNVVNLSKSDIQVTNANENINLRNNIPVNIPNNPLINTGNQSELSFKDFKYNKTGFSLEFRNSMVWNLPKETIYPSWISKFNNTGLSVLYDLSDNLKVGADIRQESFFLKYNGYDNFSQTFLYQQQPNFFSYGLLLRYTPDIVYEGFKPSLQAMVATNSYGIIGRANLGLEYHLFTNLSVQAQVELSNLYFKHLTGVFTAKKISINYGINYSF